MGRVSDRSTREAMAGDAGSTAPASPVDEALSLLTRAQNLADQLRADANREVSEARAEATRVRGETQDARSEEHTSELQSQSHISYAVFCLKKKKKK